MSAMRPTPRGAARRARSSKNSLTRSVAHAASREQTAPSPGKCPVVEVVPQSAGTQPAPWRSLRAAAIAGEANAKASTARVMAHPMPLVARSTEGSGRPATPRSPHRAAHRTPQCSVSTAGLAAATPSTRRRTFRQVRQERRGAHKASPWATTTSSARDEQGYAGKDVRRSSSAPSPANPRRRSRKAPASAPGRIRRPRLHPGAQAMAMSVKIAYVASTEQPGRSPRPERQARWRRPRRQRSPSEQSARAGNTGEHGALRDEPSRGRFGALSGVSSTRASPLTQRNAPSAPAGPGRGPAASSASAATNTSRKRRRD